jgi:hypothetical protein
MKKHTINIELENIDLKEENLLFPKRFIKSLGGKEEAKYVLLDIIDRYFNSEYIYSED